METVTLQKTNNRKTDRRTLYTTAVIQEAVLSLLSKKEYTEITVSAICREAEISRGTFYLHYRNIPEVIDALFDKALGGTHSMLAQIGCAAMKDERCAYPLCHFLRENTKYQSRFLSDCHRSHVFERIAAQGFHQFSEQVKHQSTYSEEELFSLFCFQLSGCLTVIKHYRNISDEAWTGIQCTIDKLLKVGFQGL